MARSKRRALSSTDGEGPAATVEGTGGLVPEAGTDAIDRGDAGTKRKRKRKKRAPEEAPPSAKIQRPDAAASAPNLSNEQRSELSSREKEARLEVYVEGLPYEASEEDVQAFFEPSGEVREVRMPRYQDSGKPRGYCHVCFGDEDAVQRALGQDGADMMGRYLKVQRARAPRALRQSLQGERPPPPPGCRKVFVKNLPYDTSEDLVKASMQVCGKITDVRLARHRQTGNLKGFGYVDFATEQAATIAVGKADLRIGGRVVLVDYDVGKPKGSFRRADGRHWRKGAERG